MRRSLVIFFLLLAAGVVRCFDGSGFGRGELVVFILVKLFKFKMIYQN